MGALAGDMAPVPAASAEAEQRFQRYAAQAVEDYMREFPENAVAYGRQELADKMNVPYQTSRTRAAASLRPTTGAC